MKKKFLNALLFGAALLTVSSTFVACKDYDDDIQSLQEQINAKAATSDLASQITNLQSMIASGQSDATAAKTAAETALANAKEALEKAGSAASASEVATLKENVEKAEQNLQAEIEKLASLEQLNKTASDLKKELEAAIDACASKEDLEKAVKTLSGKLDTAYAQTLAVLGHRLSTLAVIPTTHVNGIAAIEVVTLKYTPQVHQTITPHEEATQQHPGKTVLDHVAKAGAKANFISTENNVAYYHVSPNNGVRTQDIDKLVFNCITSTNTTRASMVAEDSPIKPVKWSVDKNVLTVNFKKTVTDQIKSGSAHASATNNESFYMASLKASISKENLNADEKEAWVNSEYVRVEESIRLPYIANSNTDFSKLIRENDFANETQTVNGKDIYVHYHDSVCLYKSEANEYIDYTVKYDEPVDLKKYVTVCTTTEENAKNHSAHAELKNYADYGLAFRFYLAKAPYNTLGGEDKNSNKTDQQKFASIDSPENGIMTSKVYTINGGSATAVGREPIVRVDLIDTNNGNALVAQRYIKFHWSKEVGEKAINHGFENVLYTCGDVVSTIGTQEMNEAIYDKAKEGGMTKKEFHSVYTDAGFDGKSGKGEGTVALKINDQDEVESYNIVWTLTHADIVAKYPDYNKQDVMSFSKVFTWKDPSNSYPTLVVTLTRNIYKPAFGLYGYDGRYWKNDGQWNVFNVNPIVYNTVEANPAWAANTKNNPTNNIYTDLLNGFLDVKGVKPTLGADWAIYYTDKDGKKIDYSKKYEATGVNFVFDAEKLAKGAAYVYDYFDGTQIKQMRATVSADGTKLYINKELAATIANWTPNNLKPEEMTYNIKLEEANPTHDPRTGDAPTEAAKAIVGKYVPIKMVADICNDNVAPVHSHVVTIKAYDAFIIEPLKAKDITTENFKDATIGGSTISVAGANTYLSWNADEKGAYYPVANGPKATPLEKELWEFYECNDAEWMTDKITTNLKLVNGNLVPTAGVTNGPLPSNTTVVYNGSDETLTYNNYSGTPVNWDYEIYVPVKYGYKWKTFTKTVTVKVKKNEGSHD